jgi:hypothetical protein
MQQENTPPSGPAGKRCSRCATVLPAAAFGPQLRSGIVGLRTYCRACTRVYYRTRTRPRLSPEYHRARSLLRRYGLTPGQYAGRAIRQGGQCAICGLERRLVVDHSHRSGVVRGLLCLTCNAAIAILDNPRWLSQALRYLGSCA